jgi:hypothetical protein
VNRSRLPGHLIAGNGRQKVGIDAVNVETSPVDRDDSGRLQP